MPPCACARACSNATAEASAPTGASMSCARSRRGLLGTVDIVARPEDFWPPTSMRWLAGQWRSRPRTCGFDCGRLAGRWFASPSRYRPHSTTSPSGHIKSTSARWSTQRVRGLPRSATTTSRSPSLCRALARRCWPAAVSLIVDGQAVSQSLIKAIWTDDPATLTLINARVAHYSDQAELASAIADGLAARSAGNVSRDRASRSRRGNRGGERP